jgi:hypothetical protein
MVRGFIDGTERIGDAFQDLIKNMIATIAEQAIVSGLFSFIPGIGPALGPVASGATFAQSGGVLDFSRGSAMNPWRAQAGLIVSGTVGRDSEHVLAQRGEAFLDRSLTDMLRQDLMERRSERGRQVLAPQVTNHISMPLSIHTAVSDLNTLNQWLDEDVIPRVNRQLSSGGYRTAS